MSTLFRLPQVHPVDGSGTPYAGAKANFYETGTATPQNTYTDSALVTPHANPVVADADGRFDPIYLDPDLTYKLTLTQSDDTLIYTEDPVNIDFTADNIGRILWPQTSAESGAGVTPTDYSYEPGDVRRYGAAVDDSTDDTTAVQNAVDSTHNVLLGAGTSVITSAITLDNAGQKFAGRGKGLSILRQTTINRNGIDIQADNVLVADLQVKDITQNDAAEYWGIFTNGVYDGIEIRSCKVDTADDAGIRIGYNTGTGSPSTNSRVINCDVENVTAGSGIEIIRGDDVLVQGCTISGTYQHGIRLAGTQRCRCVGNYMYQWAEQGSGAAISIQGAGSGGGVDEGANKITVTGNQGSLGTSIAETGTRSAILIQDECEDISVTGNRFDLTDTTGSTSVYGLLIRENAAGATFAAKRVVFSSNVIEGDLSFGALLTTEIENALISNNIFQGFDDYGLRLTGADTITGSAIGNIFIGGDTPTAIFQNSGGGANFLFWMNSTDGADNIHYFDAVGTATASLDQYRARVTRSGDNMRVYSTQGEHPIETGDRIQFETTGTLPTGLSAATDYWAIRIDDDDIQVASTMSNAVALTQITLSSAGTGNHTVVVRRGLWANAVRS